MSGSKLYYDPRDPTPGRMNPPADGDPSPGGLLTNLAIKLEAHVGAVNGLTKELSARRLRKPKPPAQPVFGRTVGTGTFTTGQLLVFRFPLAGPDQGHFWYVRNIVVGGLSPTTAATGRADVYVSAANLGIYGNAAGTLSQLGLSDWRDQAVTMPNVAFYGRGALPLRDNEELYIVISSGTNGQQYVAAVQFEDFEEGNVKEDWAI